MTDTKQLNDEDLEKVLGGTLTTDAQDWFDRNRSVLEERFKAKFKDWWGFMWESFRLGPELRNTAQVKDWLREYIEVDDLN